MPDLAHDRFRPAVEPLDGRLLPSTTPWVSGFTQAVTAEDGGPPRVRLLTDYGSEVNELLAYDPAFRGGVRAAVGDVTGDGLPDLVTAAGPGGSPHVKVIDGKTGAVLRNFFAFHAGFTGGVEVAVGDVNRDGFGDVITGAGSGGGPHVKVFDGKTGAELFGYFAYPPNFTGGVYVASGDLNRDGYDDVITGAGVGGGPHVRAVDGKTGADLTNFYAFDPAFRGGARVASGDLNADRVDDLIVAAGPGGGPHVKAFNSRTGELLFNRFVADAGFRDGVRVTTVSPPSFTGQDYIVASTRTGDVVDVTTHYSNSDSPGLPLKVWVGDGDPPPVSETTLVVGPTLASGVHPVRVIQGTVTGVAADGKSMTLARGDGSTVTLDLAGDPVLPDGAIYIEGSIDAAEFLLGDLPATVADVQPGRWVRVKVGRAYSPWEEEYMAMAVQVL